MQTRNVNANTASFLIHPAALVAGITVLAGFLSFWYLGSKSIWWDESVSIGLAWSDWSTLFHIITHGEANMSLYYFLLHFWVNLGSSEFMVRSLSAIFAVLTIPVIAMLGFRLFNTRAGLLAALILAINPFFIQYAQEARSYSLVLLLASLSSLLLVESLRQPAKWKWVLYVLTSVLGVYAHVLVILVPAAQAVSLLFVRREALPWKALLTAGISIILLALPIILNVLLSSAQNVEWITQPGPMELIWVVNALAGDKYLLAAFFIIGAIAIYPAVRKRTISRKSPLAWNYALVVSWLLVPIAAAFIVSQVKPLFVARYLIFCCTPIALLAAAGISRIPGRWIMAASIVVILALSGLGLKTWYFDTFKQDCRGSTAYVISEAQKGDAIVFYAPYISTPFNYYRERSGLSADIPAPVLYFDAEMYTPTPVLVVPQNFSVGGRLPPVDPTLINKLAGYKRVWLVISHEHDLKTGRDAQAQAIQDMLYERYGSHDERDFYGVRVLLYTSG